MPVTPLPKFIHQAGNRYLGVFGAMKVTRPLSEFSNEQLGPQGEKLTARGMQST